MDTKQAAFTPAQAELVGEFYRDWESYYSDGSNAEPENLHSDDVTLEHALIEQAHAARFAWDGKTLIYVPGCSLLGDICYQLEDVINDIYQERPRRRAAGGALAKLQADNTY